MKRKLLEELRRRVIAELTAYRDSKRNTDKRARHLRDRKEAGYV